MTPFEGREFLSSYEKNRQKILDKIKNNQTVNSLSHTLKLLQKQFLIDIKSDQKMTYHEDSDISKNAALNLL